MLKSITRRRWNDPPHSAYSKTCQMGSDNKPKHNGGSKRIRLQLQCYQSFRIWRRPSTWRKRNIYIMCAVASIAFVLYLANRYHYIPSPELLFFDSFDENETPYDYESHFANITRSTQCQATAARVFRCQKEAKHTLVLGCHRRWCNSFGHCDACAGIGDRFYNFGFNHIQHAMGELGDYPLVMRDAISAGHDKNNKNSTATGCNFRIEFDYPAPGISILRSAMYQDQGGWIAELFRYRSYQTIKHDRPPEFLRPAILVAHLMSGKMNWRSGQTHEPIALMSGEFWDPCLFHSYFRPNARMQRELQYHQTNLDKDHNTTIIAIHFRTGDALSFQDVMIPEDVRIEKGKSLQTGWEQMKRCAKELVKSSPEYASKKYVKFVLASDSVAVKRMAREEVDMDIYTTQVKPSSFRQNPGRDTDAWMELFLLARQDGFVMNALADEKSYKGGAGPISSFAKLVERVGFYRKDQVKVCPI